MSDTARSTLHIDARKFADTIAQYTRKPSIEPAWKRQQIGLGVHRCPRDPDNHR